MVLNEECAVMSLAYGWLIELKDAELPYLSCLAQNANTSLEVNFSHCPRLESFVFMQMNHR